MFLAQCPLPVHIMTAVTMGEGSGTTVPERLQTVAENPFCVTWQLPGYPGARLVDCGVHIAALHCWPQRADRILVYGKAELTACYESKDEQGKLHFVGATRYLSMDVSVKSTVDRAQEIKGYLAGDPVCTLIDAAEHLGKGERDRNQVQVEGVIQLLVSVRKHEEEVQSAVATESSTSPDLPPPMRGPLPSYTEPPLDDSWSKTPLTGGRGRPTIPESSPPVSRRAPFVPRGAESIPPTIWTMPERG
jgi:hypothetical protein